MDFNTGTSLRVKTNTLQAAAAMLSSALIFCACDGSRSLQETPLPPSQSSVTLEHFQPPEALDQIGEWYPKDWRLQLFRALMDTSWEEKVAGLRSVDGLKPHEPVVLYELCLAFLERDKPEEEKMARPYLDQALALDPDNGVLRVLEAYMLLKEGQVGKARELFLDPRRIPSGDFYYPRLQELLLGLFSHARHLNPYTLTEAVEIFRKVPLPPFEKMINILYSVFLSPLPEHPYDIRVRGREAADGLFQLGRRLRVQSYAGPQILTVGYEQQALGFMFQLKASEFLTLFYRAFEDTTASQRAFQELVDAQKEYDAFQESRNAQDTVTTLFLENWSNLIKNDPGLKLSQAVQRAREWGLWRRAMALRYPKRDDP